MLKIFNKILLTIAIISFVTILASCTDIADNQSNNDENLKQDKERLEEANRYLVQQEKEIINEYIKNCGYDFVETGTGLRYCIISQVDSTLIKTGNIVSMEFEVRLINGEIIYTSENEGLKVFQVGRGGVERGLEEAILHLHKGDRAEIIIPSYLAHGLTGDGKGIPPRSILVYKVKVIDNK